MATGQMCSGCKETKAPEAFGWYTDSARLRKKCKSCRSADERKRTAENRPLRHCSVCGGQMSAQYKLEVCRRNPECLRISTSQHNFLQKRRQQICPPCAGCGCDWLRAGGGEKLCPECRETRFWCSGFQLRTSHIASLATWVSLGACRACRLLRHARPRAVARRVPFALTSDYVESIWNDTCPYLGIPLVSGVKKLTRSSPTLDRIVPGAGYVEGNVEVISFLANTMKSAAGPGELLTFARAVLRRSAAARVVA